MEILTGEQMRSVDRRAIDTMGIPGLELMENAGRGVAEALLDDFPELRTRGVLILCGKGNNGGDGLVAARYLAGMGITPQVFLLADGSELKGDAAANLEAAVEAGLEICEIPDEPAWLEARSLLEGPRLILDALLGTGVQGGARGLIGTVIEALNEAPATVVSVDLPSGINADSPEVEGRAVWATRTYTLCRPKIALVLGTAAAHAGKWRVVPIGIPDVAVLEENVDLEWFEARAARDLLPARESESHKGTFGHLLVVAGSCGKSGAAVLVGRGALRCGAGLVTVGTPLSAQERVAVQQAELMTEGLAETVGGGLAPQAVDAVRRLSESRDALAIGPGLGQEPDTYDAVLQLVRSPTLPTVVDADGLNALAAGTPPRWPLRHDADASLILSPHPGEAARLLGVSTANVQADRIAAARELAEISGAVVVLKGHRTAVARPGGTVSLNASGNPGMATAGTGDVLTGVLGALLARGFSAWDAARLGAWVHGDAGDRAARRLGQEGLIASDVVDRLPASLMALGRALEGDSW